MVDYRAEVDSASTQIPHKQAVATSFDLRGEKPQQVVHPRIIVMRSVRYAGDPDEELTCASSARFRGVAHTVAGFFPGGPEVVQG